MKMIYVGSLSTEPDRDSGWIREIADLGWGISTLSTEVNLSGGGIIKKLKKRFQVGREYRLLCSKLLGLADELNPQWIHFRLPVEFGFSTIQALKRKGVVVTEYFNDDPFSAKSPVGLYRTFRSALPVYDAHYVYRMPNVNAFEKAGGVFVEHCPPAYDPSRHNLGQFIPNRGFLADCAFIGHWEGDWRTACLDAIHNSGLSVIVKGGMWDRSLRGRSIAHLAPVKHAFGDEYNRIYSGVVAGLCFFSKINNDSWTERALEIIAVGGVLVCERTVEAEAHFVDKKEAMLFSTTEELISIIYELKANPAQRSAIRDAGYRRLLSGAHTIGDRARQVEKFVRESLAGDSNHK